MLHTDFALENATYNELYNIAVNDDDLDVKYEATRQIQNRRKLEKVKHKKYIKGLSRLFKN